MSPARHRILPALLIFILAAALGPARAFAKDTEKSWEFGAFYMISRYAGSTNMNDGYGWGARAGYHVKAIHEFEGTLDVASASDAKVSDVTFDVTKFSADYMRVYILKGHEKMIPYASFGLGIMKVDNGTDTGNSMDFRLGGGFKYWIKPHGGFRFDVKMYRWNGDGKVIPSDSFYAVDWIFSATFLVGGPK